jgi:broad specificity phosphatase PhoE
VIPGLWRLLGGGRGRPAWDLPGRRRGEHFLVVVRAASSGGVDGGLSGEGRAQAEAMAAAVAPLGPLPLLVAPERPSRETAAVLEARWTTTARMAPALAGHRPGASPASEPTPALGAWRGGVVAALEMLDADTVVVAGGQVVAALVSEATGDVVDPDRVPPGSRTTLRLGPEGLHLLRFAHQADSGVR